jgi:hypothetical protein
MADPLATDGIVATAFDLVELRAPSSLSDDSDEAELANRHYRKALDSVLEKSDWSFARAIVPLNQVDVTASGLQADPDLPFVFALPDQTIKVWRIMADHSVWRRDGLFIRADQDAPITARVTLRITDETKLPATFQLAVAYALARLISPKLSTSLGKRQQLRAEAAEALQDALEADARQGTEERYDGLPDQPDWVDEALI